MFERAHGKGYNGWSQLAILLGLAGGGIIVGGLASIPVWQMMTHSGILNIEKDMLKPENASAAQALQVVSAFFVFFIPAVLFAYICYRKPWSFLGFKEKLNSRNLLITIALILCSIPMIGLLEYINRAIPLPAATRARFDAMEKTYNETVLVMVQLKTWGQYLVSLAIIALLPALTEELLFRGGLQNLLTRWIKSPWAAIIITSILFSAVHASWYGFIVRFALGIVLGLIYYYTRNIWLNILAHFINNAIVVTSLFFVARHGGKVDMTAENGYPLWLGIIGLGLVILLIRLLKTGNPKVAFDDHDMDQFDSNNPFDERNKYA